MPPAKSKRANFSPDGKWRSFPKVPNLVQYVSTGTYFGRIKIEGKVFRESLDTNIFTDAKLLLGDFIKKKRKEAGRVVLGTFAAARALYEADLAADHTLKETAKLYPISRRRDNWQCQYQLPPRNRPLLVQTRLEQRYGTRHGWTID